MHQISLIRKNECLLFHQTIRYHGLLEDILEDNDPAARANHDSIMCLGKIFLYEYAKWHIGQ
jgi:hypothetical protein